MKRAIGPLFLVLCIAISAAGISNVMGDMGPILRAAEAKACEGKTKCRAHQSGGYTRTPFVNEIGYSVNGKPLRITCSRAYIFLGDWGCTVAAK